MGTFLTGFATTSTLLRLEATITVLNHALGVAGVIHIAVAAKTITVSLKGVKVRKRKIKESEIKTYPFCRREREKPIVEVNH
jgi:hypothetical protein